MTGIDFIFIFGFLAALFTAIGWFVKKEWGEYQERKRLLEEKIKLYDSLNQSFIDDR